ncbi:MAG: zeta toxin family protein [Candidatus Taylorbacteria bacterium]
MDEAEKIKLAADEFARANKKRIAKELTDTSKYAPDEVPFSVFMAGSPGAGKTEVSKALINTLEAGKKHKVIRIDGDELRRLIPGYTGSNSYLFQGAVSILVDRIHDLALDKKQTFLLDGTFSKYEKAVNNIKRSLARSRLVMIFYVYQQPEVAWKFTEAREKLEGRNIPKSAFVDSFIESRETICRIRKDFDDKVVIFLVKKNFETHDVKEIIAIAQDGKQIDDYLGKAYTKDDLEKLL